MSEFSLHSVEPFQTPPVASDGSPFFQLNLSENTTSSQLKSSGVLLTFLFVQIQLFLWIRFFSDWTDLGEQRRGSLEYF